MRKALVQRQSVTPCRYLLSALIQRGRNSQRHECGLGRHQRGKEITIFVDSGHKTAENLMSRKAFTVSMATANHVAACDYVGLVSGNKEPDKFAKAGFHATKSEFVDAPLIDELPMALECEVISYDHETCRLVGRIVNVSADESVLGQNGKVDVGKLRPITFDTMNNQYLVLGEKVGQAFHDGVQLK